jgi:hypothetical protein
MALRRLPTQRRVYAYLGCRDGAGRTITRYVGQAQESTRAEALAAAWRTAREKGLLR